LAGYSTGNPSLDGNGIAINPTSSVPLPNHITIENNTVYNEPGGGIYTEGADYVQILNNVVHDNAHWAAFGNSGISISTSANLDTNPGAHIIISGNLVYNNAQLVPTIGGHTITDGEGIILDTNTGYTGGFLVQSNTVYNNGGPGIESFKSDYADITGNTVYGNNTQNIQAPSNAQIFINQSNNNTVTNNITTAPAFSPEAAGTIVYTAEYGSAPSASEVSVLVQFTNPQYAYGQQIGVMDPAVYAYQSLGVALASTATQFQNTFGPSNPTYPATPAGDTQFATDAYASVFGHPAGPAQIQQFVAQLNFFETLYTSAGGFGGPTNIDLLARGAVYGQMLGIEHEINPTALGDPSGLHASIVGIASSP
jgi:parallel beta-helix repeat protein